MKYEELMFVAQDIRFGTLYILTGKIVAFFDRRSFYRKFCNDNSIRQNASNKKYLPSRYLVEHDRITRFGKSRDRIIAQVYLKYTEKAENTEYAIKKLVEALHEQEGTIKKYESDLEVIKKKAAQEKNPAEAIYLESVASNIDTSIKNQKLHLKEMEERFAELQGIKINNQENWDNQLKQIEDEVDICITDFIRALTKKVKRKLDFSNFYYITPEYSEKVKLIKGASTSHASSTNKK